MCLVILAYRVIEGFPVVLAANRDEFTARGGEPPQMLGPKGRGAKREGRGRTKRGRARDGGQGECRMPNAECAMRRGGGEGRGEDQGRAAEDEGRGATRSQQPSTLAPPASPLPRLIWGGRDPVAGGTWLGVNARGLVVALMDRPAERPDPRRRSRGLLCLDALRQESAAALEGWLRAELRRQPYNPFNLLYADRASAGVAYYEAPVAEGTLKQELERGTRTGFGEQGVPRPSSHLGVRGGALGKGNREGSVRVAGVSPGIHVLTGGLLCDRREPKIARAFELLADMPREWPGAFARLRRVCADRRDTAPESEQICMRGEKAGTVSSSILAVGEGFPAGSFYFHAPGPPCEAEYRDYSGLFGM